MTSNAWAPKLVALDIDGTLLKWVEGAGTTYEEIAPAVGDAVRRARDAGCHIVLARGRSPHGMTKVADLLELHRDGAEPLWIVASNGAVVFRYPPIEVVREETFDAAPAVRAVFRRRSSLGRRWKCCSRRPLTWRRSRPASRCVKARSSG